MYMCVQTFQKHFNVHCTWCYRTSINAIFAYFFFLNSTYNSIRKHSSAVFLRQRKLGEMFDFSTLNDLCVIWGTMFNNASHYMIIFRGYFELIQAMNIEVELNYS